MTLSFTTQQFKEKVKKCMKQNNILIPIIMFNKHDNTHWVEHILVIRIEESVDIGISLRFNNDNNKIEISGIHLDEEYIKNAHQFALPQHINECKCLDHWQSNITDLKILGNLDDDENKIKNYEQRYKTMKKGLWSVINEEKTNDNVKKTKLRSIIKRD